MNHWQRIEATIAGEETDQVPVALWQHFPEDDRDVGKLVKHTIAWQEKWDFDLLKFMPSGTYGVEDWGAVTAYLGTPNGARTVTKTVIHTPEDWQKLPALDVKKGCYAEQNAALKQVAQSFSGKTPLLQTVFSPLTTARKLAGESLFTDLRCNPDALKAGLRTITDVTIEFALAALESGAHGIFFATQMASTRLLSTDEYSQFGRAYDLEVFAALKGKAKLNMVHAHGEDVMFSMLAEYPVEMLNWHDRTTKPNLQEAAKVFPKVLVGGLNEHATVLNGQADEIKAEILDAMNQTQGRRLIIAPGCVLPLAISDREIQAVLNAAKALAGQKYPVFA